MSAKEEGGGEGKRREERSRRLNSRASTWLEVSGAQSVSSMWENPVGRGFGSGAGCGDRASQGLRRRGATQTYVFARARAQPDTYPLRTGGRTDSGLLGLPLGVIL